MIKSEKNEKPVSLPIGFEELKYQKYNNNILFLM